MSEIFSEGAARNAERGGMVAGVTSATVTRNDDPEGLGRVKLRFPWRTEPNFESDWARIVTPMAGPGRGMFLLPEVDDEVLVAFDRNDPRHPYVLGSLWSSVDKPPASNSDGKNDIRVLRSRKGHMIRIDDGSKGAITISLDNQRLIEIHDDGIRIDDTKSSVELDARSGAVTITAAATLSLKAKQVSIEAETAMDLKGGQALNASATMVRIN